MIYDGPRYRCLAEIDDLPDEYPPPSAFIYFLYRDDELLRNYLLYIGATTRIDERLKLHVWNGIIPFNRHELILVELDKLSEIERKLIKEYQPPFNLRYTDKYEYARPEINKPVDLGELVGLL